MLDKVGFGCVCFVVDEGNNDNRGKVAEFCGDIEGFGREDKLCFDSVGRRREYKKSFSEHP